MEKPRDKRWSDQVKRSQSIHNLRPWHWITAAIALLLIIGLLSLIVSSHAVQTAR
jgi:CHASE3 domain sensor protein